MSLAFAVDFDAELLPAIKRSTESERVAAGGPGTCTLLPTDLPWNQLAQRTLAQKKSGWVLNNQY